MSDADPRDPNNAWSGGYPSPRPAPYGVSPYATPSDGEHEHDRPFLEMADVWTALLGTISVLIVGVIATFIWVWVAPRTVAVKDAKGGVSLLTPETKAFAGADSTYFLVTLGAGLLCGAVAALVARHRGLAVTVALGGGGLLSALMVAWLGRWLTGGPLVRWAHHASTGNHDLFIQLQTRPFIMTWPIAALVVTFFVALASSNRPPN